MLPSKLNWLDAAIASALGVGTTKLDLIPWLQSRQVTVADNVAQAGVDVRWLGLISLMVNKPPQTHAVAAEKKE